MRISFFQKLLLMIFFHGSLAAQVDHAFRVIPLGVKGGGDESNLSAYLVAPNGSDDYVCVDAGTIYKGLEKAISNRLFTTDLESVLKKNIKSYLISHAHLDHVAGLVINSTEDATKNIYALASTLENLEKNYFNWKSWPNFADKGDAPLIKRYRYKTLLPSEEIAIENTSMAVVAFPLSHGHSYQSTAFLIRNDHNYLLYLGDTGSDELEKSNHLAQLWQQIAPLIKKGQLRAIFLEVSFPVEQPDNALFGHLTPKWFFKEMEALSALTQPEGIRGLNVIVTHMKPVTGNEQKITDQLNKRNEMGLRLTFPEQGVLYRL